MEIKKVHYSALVNLGDYNNERIGFTVEVNNGEIVEEVIIALREKVKANIGHNVNSVFNIIQKQKQEIDSIEIKLKRARKQWDATKDFLKAQGIKTDAADMPQFNFLLAPAEDESVFVSEIESDNDDDMEY